jgi:F-type H+-transporting ATPase subunit delta
MSLAVATRYARALLELGQETKTLETLIGELERAAATYEANAELRAALANPLLSRDAKNAIISDVASALGLAGNAKNTLRLLADRRRIAELPAITRRLRELVDREQGLVHADVVSAARLSAGFYDRLKAELEKLTGKKIALRSSEDPSLIGGVVIRIGDTVIDGSLKSRLDSLKQSLLPN